MTPSTTVGTLLMPNPYPQLMLAAGLWCVPGRSVADDGRWPMVDGGALSGKIGATVNTTTSLAPL